VSYRFNGIDSFNPYGYCPAELLIFYDASFNEFDIMQEAFL
jgi:hypothetical protein